MRSNECLLAVTYSRKIGHTMWSHPLPTKQLQAYLVLSLPVQLLALGSVGLLQLVQHCGQQAGRVAAGLQVLG